MELINVGLYGDGSRKSRLRAEYIHCDHAEECSTYKKGKCFCVTTPFGIECPIGTVSFVDGGLKNSKAYSRIWSSAKENPCYHKLYYPYHEYITCIGQKAFITIPYVRIEEQGEKLFCYDPGFRMNRLLVDEDKLTPENIKRICEYQPHAMMGGVIEDYQKKSVPLFLNQLSKTFPERFQEFVKAEPDYEIKTPDYVGRRAKLLTCNRSEVYFDNKQNQFRFDGDWLVCEKYRSSFTPFGSSTAEIRIKATEDMVVKITNNNQVTWETVFDN